MCPSAECCRFCICCCCQLGTDPRLEPPNPVREDRSLPREYSEENMWKSASVIRACRMRSLSCLGMSSSHLRSRVDARCTCSQRHCDWMVVWSARPYMYKGDACWCKVWSPAIRCHYSGYCGVFKSRMYVTLDKSICKMSKCKRGLNDVKNLNQTFGRRYNHLCHMKWRAMKDILPFPAQVESERPWTRLESSESERSESDLFSGSARKVRQSKSAFAQ